MSEQENQIEVNGEIESESIVRNSTEDHPSEKVILNVGGIKYETYRSTLTSYPQTLLGTMFHPRNRVMLHPTNGNEYFIDRNGYAFHYVMEYYRTGTIVWRPTVDLPCGGFPPSPQSSSTPCSIEPSQNRLYTEINNATVPTRAAAALVAHASSSGTGFLNPTTSPPSNPAPLENSSCCECHCHNSPRPYVSLPELEQEFNYFQIPFTSRVSVAHKAAAELLDSFTYAVEELLYASIARLMDRVSITFYRDGSQIECIILSRVSKLREFDINGYCIVNHFYDEIRKYLVTIFPNMKVRLEFGYNYKNLTMSMTHLFTKDNIIEHARIGNL